MQSYCCSMHDAPSALHADMDRAIRNQSGNGQLSSPCSPPVAAWRRSHPATLHFAHLACGWFRLARTCGH
eukprot:11207584-Lingulodinium_polyedra.AAC.1